MPTHVDKVRELVKKLAAETEKILEEEIDQAIRTRPNQCLGGTHVSLSREPDQAVKDYLIRVFKAAGWKLSRFTSTQQHNDTDWSCWITPLPETDRQDEYRGR